MRRGGTGGRVFLPYFVETAALTVEPVSAAIKAAVSNADIAHPDETGFYIKGQRHWLSTLSSQELTYYQPHAKRGKGASDEIGILPQFTGTLVYDSWATYFSYQGLLHALCNAHHYGHLSR